MIALALVAALLGVADAGAAATDAASDEQATFDHAAELIAAGRDAEAAAQLEAIATRAPHDRIADEALFEAAKLYDEPLAAPTQALALYRRIVRDYPDSRVALAAGRRAELLARRVGSGPAEAAAAARFAAIQRDFDPRAAASAIAAADALVRANPGWSGAAEVALWLADLAAHAGDAATAEARYAEVVRRWPETAAGFAGALGAARAALAQHEPAAAARYLAALGPIADAGRQAAVDEVRGELALAESRARWRTGAAVALALGLVLLGASLLRAAGGARAALRGLWPPPLEALYLAPVAALLGAAAFTAHAGAGPAVSTIGTGGVLVTWLSGAGLRAASARPGRRWPRALGHAAIALACTIAIAYLALARADLLDLVRDTLRGGPDP